MKYIVIPSVKSSVTGAVIQIPSKPQSAENTKIEMSRITIPRALEIIADSFAIPHEVKYIDAIMLKPCSRNTGTKSLSPCVTMLITAPSFTKMRA